MFENNIIQTNYNKTIPTVFNRYPGKQGFGNTIENWYNKYFSHVI